MAREVESSVWCVNVRNNQLPCHPGKIHKHRHPKCHRAPKSLCKWPAQELEKLCSIPALGIVVGSTVQPHWCWGSQISQRWLLQFQHIDQNWVFANEHLWTPWCTSTPLFLVVEATESSLMEQARSEGSRYWNLEDLIEYFYYIFLEPSLSPPPSRNLIT